MGANARARAPVERGLILAAGVGRRLLPHTERLPKALVPLVDGSTVLERVLANFAEVGLDHATIVVGYRAEAIEQRIAGLEDAHRLDIDLVENCHAEDRNNAYSLWCAREALRAGVLLSNGDTLHPAEIQRELLGVVDGAICLAVDADKRLGDEEMKVRLEGGRLRQISKLLPHDSDGEYIGVAVIPAAAALRLVDALEQTWRNDASEYYEAAFQALAAGGHRIDAHPIGTHNWIEIDDLSDLARANGMLCPS